MRYIIIDLEWNQPVSYQSRVYREYGDRLIFEMIQIGAAKLDEQMKVVDTVSIPIRPTCYERIHPRIRRMTGLGEAELAEAPQFAEAMERFRAWCGEDYTLLTWGCDDISVLQQNLDFFGDKSPMPPVCDAQKLFSDVHRLKERAGLKLAMELMQLQPEEEKPFHNAEFDAYYTALVFATCPEPNDVLKYPLQAKKLIHAAHTAGKKPSGVTYATVEEALSSAEARAPHCPVCGREVELDGSYIPQTPDKYISLAKCRQHGPLMVRLRFHVTQGDRKQLDISVAKAAPSNCAYVRTKRIQFADKVARYQAAHEGRKPDMDEALLNADRSSVPFEEGQD